MASDYKPEQAFAERRGITFRERIVEIARQLPERAKSIFAGFRPNSGKLEVIPPEQARFTDQRRAVERFARALDDIGRMREQGLPTLPHQRVELERTSKALDAVRPQAATDLGNAFQRQPELIREAAAGRTQGAMLAMSKEAEIRIDPALRADRFVSDWQRLGQARQGLQRDGDTEGARRISANMADMAKGLERDTQVEALLRDKLPQLGLEKMLGRNLAHDLAATVTIERTRDIGMGM